jgi:hypothetical protein
VTSLVFTAPENAPPGFNTGGAMCKKLFFYNILHFGVEKSLFCIYIYVGVTFLSGSVPFTGR